MPWAICLVALGGALGSSGRYLVAQLLAPVSTQFPWASFVVNVLGSFLIGFVSQFFVNEDAFAQNMKLFVAKGFCGGFTTFSSFSLENLELLESGQTFLAGVNMLASLGCCLIGVSAGMYCAGLLKR